MFTTIATGDFPQQQFGIIFTFGFVYFSVVWIFHTELCLEFIKARTVILHKSFKLLLLFFGLPGSWPGIGGKQGNRGGSCWSFGQVQRSGGENPEHSQLQLALLPWPERRCRSDELSSWCSGWSKRLCLCSPCPALSWDSYAGRVWAHSRGYLAQAQHVILQDPAGSLETFLADWEPPARCLVKSISIQGCLPYGRLMTPSRGVYPESGPSWGLAGCVLISALPKA